MDNFLWNACETAVAMYDWCMTKLARLFGWD